MRTIFAYGHAALFLLLIIPKMFWLRRKPSEQAYNEANRLTKKLSDRTLRIASTDVAVHGQHNVKEKESYLYVSNHQGNFDIPLLLSHVNINLSFIAKKSLQNVPLFGTWMTYKQCIFLDQEKPREAIRKLKEAGEMVQAGKSVCIFPEGHRSKGSFLGEFSNSAARISKKIGIPVLPITIDGSYKILEENNGQIKPARVNIHVHPPLNPEQYGTTAEFNEVIENTIAAPLRLEKEKNGNHQH
ncbi:lysophospholipid acyltransferase family protein [Geomicrobium sp. JSM 1781026]|uniref:lysophospholipid acyltransferase family protein n=1 Tax=Geomicrobium sp. JSM 1781026 TaxID=3344580 RepID=UPI0035C0E6DE